MIQNTLTPNLLKTKQHFQILDGLRGVAAVAVVIYHFMEIAITDYNKNFMAHGFLAVDFFFCLSGFVIGYAYDDRIEKIGVWQFFKLRLIRLHPLVIFGSILGLFAYLFDPFFAPFPTYGIGKIFLIFLSSIFLIPYPVMPERTFNLFIFNAPAWSLFWEYIANIAFAIGLYRIKMGFLTILTIISACGIVFINYRSGNLMGGWGGPTFWDGFVRLCYSFFAGLLIYRSNWIIKNNLGFIRIGLLLSLTFIVPYGRWNLITESLAVLIYFPLIIALGVGATLSNGLKNLCDFSGKISYPLYMSHYWALWMFANYLTANKPDRFEKYLVVALGVLLLVGFSHLVTLFFDIPIRKYLGKLLLKNT
jgi:peptidoglycan/LPS O-acetylase OafA/YrhL